MSFGLQGGNVCPSICWFFHQVSIKWGKKCCAQSGIVCDSIYESGDASSGRKVEAIIEHFSLVKLSIGEDENRITLD